MIRAIDTTGESTVLNSVVFFQDDRVITGEESAGEVASIALYSSALSPSQVRDLA